MSSTSKIDKNIHKLLVLGAFQPEIEDIVRSSLSQIPFLLHGKKIQIETALVGVGSVQAAIFLQDYLSENIDIAEIIFFGSAGAYSTLNSEIGKMHICHNFHQIDVSVMEQKAVLPVIMETEYSTKAGFISNELITNDNFLTERRVNSTNSITIQITIKEETKPGLPELENLECFGLAAVAQKNKIPLSCLLIVTNLVDDKGSENWKKNHISMGKKLKQEFLNNLKNLM